MSTKKTWLILMIMVLITLLGQFDKNSIAVAAVPISQEFGLSKSQMGIVISCFYFSYTIMNLFGGFLSDIYGSRKVTVIITMFWSLFTGLTGFAWSFASLLGIRFVFGLAEGAFPSAQSLLVAELFPKEKRAFPKSFITGASAVGMGLGAIVITYIAYHMGWRNAFYIYCIAGFVISMIFFFCSKEMKRPVTYDNKTNNVSYKNVLKVPLMWKIIPMQFAGGAFLWGLNSWMPSYWMNVKGLKLTSMGLAAAIPNLAAAITILIMGWLLDKYLLGEEKWVIAGGAAMAVLFSIGTFMANNVVLGVTCMTIATISAAMIAQTNMVCIIKYFPQNTIGTGAGIGNGAGQLAGMLTPALMGFLLDVTSGNYLTVFGVVISLLIIAFCIALTFNTKNIQVN